MSNPTRYTDPDGESIATITVSGMLLSAAREGISTGIIYRVGGKSFIAGLTNGFTSDFISKSIAVFGAKSGPKGIYVGVDLGEVIGPAVGSFVEDIVFNETKTPSEIAETAAKSVATGMITGASVEYIKYAVEFVNKAGSAARILSEYDENFGTAIEVFFKTFAKILDTKEKAS